MAILLFIISVLKKEMLELKLCFLTKKSKKCLLKKPPSNPLIKPRQENSWEAFNTFNPAAVYEAGKVHIFYRAQGFDYISVVGYANSEDGINLLERLNYPV